MQSMNIQHKCIEDFRAESFPSIIIDLLQNTDDLRYRMDFEEKTFNGSSIYKDSDLSYCMDPRYQISIAKTSSDCHSGRNAASKIIQFMM